MESLYPSYPGADRAGWGLLMLTNMLPAGGNGTYVLHAEASDVGGQATTLGSGIHPLAWSVTDNLGRTEGLGSRFFWVAN